MSAGTVNVLTVLNTENALFTAEDALVQVEYARLQALVDLFTALGGGWHLDEVPSMKIPSMSRNHALLATAAAVILGVVAWRSFHKPAQAAGRGAAPPIAVDMVAAASSDVPIYLQGWAPCRPSIR